MGIYATLRSLKNNKYGPKISKDEIKAMDILLRYDEQDMRKELKKLINYEKELKKYILDSKKTIDTAYNHSDATLQNSILFMSKHLKSRQDKYEHQIKFMTMERNILLKNSQAHNIHLDPHSSLMKTITKLILNKDELELEVDELKERIERLTV